MRLAEQAAGNGVGDEFTDLEMQAAHELIDLAKAGRWEHLYTGLRMQQRLVNMRPAVREYGVLHQAAFFGNMPAVQTLLETFGADASMRTKSGLTSAEIAKQRGHTQIESFLAATAQKLSDHAGDTDAALAISVEQQPDGIRKSDMGPVAAVAGSSALARASSSTECSEAVAEAIPVGREAPAPKPDAVAQPPLVAQREGLRTDDIEGIAANGPRSGRSSGSANGNGSSSGCKGSAPPPPQRKGTLLGFFSARKPQ